MQKPDLFDQLIGGSEQRLRMVPQHKFLALRKPIDGGNEPQEELIVGFDGGAGALDVVIHGFLLIKKMAAPPPNTQETKRQRFKG